MATINLPGQKYTEGTLASQLAADYASIIKGKTILTTGVTPGSIGAAYVESVAAASPALLILAGRSADKLAQEAANIKAKHPDVPTRTLVVDLMSLDSVRKAAAEVNAWDDVKNIDVVHNCAGIMAHPFKLSPEGYESHLAANHLGHFLLTNLLMDKILASPQPRVAIVTSNGHRLSHMRWDDLNFDVRALPCSYQPRLTLQQNGKYYDRWTAYGQSKTANMLMAMSLAEKLGARGLQSFSIHPGLIMGSGLGQHLDFSDMQKGDFATLRKTSAFHFHLWRLANAERI